MTITINIADLNRKVGEIKKFIETTVLEEVGTLEVEQIKKRTAKGIQASGEAMRPYVEATKKLRTRYHLRTSPPNLYFKGDMMNSVQYFKGGRYISVSGDQELKAEGNTRWRVFIAANVETDIPLIEKKAAKVITEKFGKK